MDEWLNAWISECVWSWINGWMNECKNGRVNVSDWVVSYKWKSRVEQVELKMTCICLIREERCKSKCKNKVLCWIK